MRGVHGEVDPSVLSTTAYGMGLEAATAAYLDTEAAMAEAMR